MLEGLERRQKRASKQPDCVKEQKKGRFCGVENGWMEKWGVGKDWMKDMIAVVLCVRG
jgi:hypothetical protein